MYSLATDFKANFSTTNESSPENIFVAAMTNQSELGNDFPMRTLHYNQLSTGGGGPWNGFATIAETYNAFDHATDQRDKMWLVGQQYSFNTGQPVNDRAALRSSSRPRSRTSSRQPRLRGYGSTSSRRFPTR